MAAGRDTIRQRIAIEGDDDIKRRLKEIGDAGEKEFKRIENVVNTGNSGLARLSSVISAAGATFRSIGATMKPAVEQIGAAREHMEKFSQSLEHVAGNVFPHFHEAVALATGASIAGLVELAKSAGEAAHEVEHGAQQLGLSVETYQALSGAAKQAGVDQETFTGTFTRLARAVGDAAVKQRDQVLDLAAKVTAGVSANGVAVLNGHAKVTSKLVGDVKATWTAIEPLAQRILKTEQEIAAQGGIPKSAIESIHQLRQGLVEFGNASEANREELAKLLPANALLPHTMAEAFLRAKDAGGDLSQRLQKMGVEAVDLATGKIRPLDETLVEFADKLKKIPDAALHAFTAQQILGRQWQKILPIISQGGDGLKDLAGKFVELGISLDMTQVKAGVELFEAFNRLQISLIGVKNLIGLAFAPVIVPLINAITTAIQTQVPAIKAWGASIAGSIEPAIKDLIALLQGADAATMQSGFAKTLVHWRDELLGIWPSIRAAFGMIISAADGVAAAINLALGTNLSGVGLIVTGLVLQLTGVLGLLVNSLTLVSSAAAVLLRLPWGPVLTMIYAGLQGVVPLLSGMLAALMGIAGVVGWPVLLIAGIAGIVAALITWQGKWGEIVEFIGQGVTAVLGFFDSVLTKIGDMIAALGRFLGLSGEASAGPMATAAIPPRGMAEGGLIHGPGTGTSDDVPIRASNGEFVVNALATRAFLPFLSAINRNLNPFAGLSLSGLAPHRFAAGGLVTAGAAAGAGTPVHLHLDGQQFALEGPSRTVANLLSAAKAQQLRRTGRMPGWNGG